MCNIQFKFWKVYIYHVVALEHVKRVALQEVSEREAKGECIIKGTNLTEEELGKLFLIYEKPLKLRSVY